MEFVISERLKSIALQVIPYRNVVDVGTDHALVPVFLVMNQIVDKAIAIDVNLGPVKSAQKNISFYGLDQQIEARLGNGLLCLKENDPIDVVIIAGMGGKLITDILTTGYNFISQNKRLVLQANTGEEVVRSWLCENHYEIVNEIILKEDHKIYEIITADLRGHRIPLSEEEIKFGPILIQHKSDVFREKWLDMLSYKQQLLNKIPETHENKDIYLSEIKQIENILTINK